MLVYLWCTKLCVCVCVCVLPLHARRGGVPLPFGGMDLRVVQPIPLAVHDVVPEFQVLDDLRDTKQGGPGDPGDLVPARQQGNSTTDHQATLQLDGPAHVPGIALAPGLLDIGSDRVQFAAQFLDVRLGEVYILADVGDGHAALLNVDGAVAGCCGDAGLDSIAGAVLSSGPQIAHVARFQRQYTGLADAHSASERHLDAELLATFHQSCRAIEFDALV